MSQRNIDDVIAHDRDTYWVSYSKAKLNPGVKFLNGFGISVCLDAGAQHHFSSIRILIVYKKGEPFHGFRVRDSLSPEAFTLAEPIQMSYRQRLLDRARTVESRTGRLEQGLKRSSLSPYIMVFEIVESKCFSPNNGRARLIELTPLTSFKYHPPYCMAYDRSFSCTPEAPAVKLYLQCDHFFGETDTSRPSADIFYYLRQPALLHNLRILPVSRKPRTRCPLPPSVVRRIAECAIADRPSGWRKTLISMALVCKTWTCAVDVFHASIRKDGIRFDLPAAASVYRSLAMNPHYGQLYRHLNPWAFGDYYLPEATEEECIKFERDFLGIMSLTPNLVTLGLSPIHASLHPDLMRSICRLRIANFLVDGLDERIFDDCLDPPSQPFTIKEVLQCASHWPGLTELEIKHLGGEEGQMTCSKSKDALSRNNMGKTFIGDVEPAAPSLQILRIMSAGIPDVPLVRLTSSRLRVLELVDVSGLRNQDLFACFTQAAPTLERLLLDLIMADIQREEDEEYALDEAMPHLTRLDFLDVAGDLLTALTISRKKRALGRSGSQRRTCISIRNAPGIRLADVADAVAVTGWNCITMPPEEDNGLAVKIEQVAQSRAVEFKWEG